MKGPERADLLVEEGLVKRLLKDSDEIKSLEAEIEKTHTIIDAQGCLVLPSFTDMHVHLREPGFSYKETIKTGTAAAAAGGFTTVCTMPNLEPAPDTVPHLKVQLALIAEESAIDVLPFGAITVGRKGTQFVDYDAMSPYVAGFSDDGSGVQSEAVMREAMARIAKTGKILAAHCEVESLLNGGYIHDGEYAKANGHKGISSESEWREVERDIRLAKETGCRLHICHVSSKESVDLIRQAKKERIAVTCETGPHYLTFCDSDLQEDGRFKMNPPLRGKADREALRRGLIDGTIDVVATDHAPHSSEEKSRGLEKSAMGVVGLETAFSALYTTMVSSGLMSFQRLIEVMALNPCKILGLPKAPGVEEATEANLTIVNLDEDYVVDPSTFKTMGQATPYEGMTLKGRVVATIYKGNPVYNSLQ
ncbi:MAG: dihydroorotase [Muribaculaceae bacterium]|nr:dihydroorotase [Muribaculaceae bacterium]